MNTARAQPQAHPSIPNKIKTLHSFKPYLSVSSKLHITKIKSFRSPFLAKLHNYQFI
jgi:hypothetical protein